MTDLWRLPESVTCGGVSYAIRTDFRDVLRVLNHFDDPNFLNEEKWEICIRIMVPDWRTVPAEKLPELASALQEFIDMGMKEEGVRKPVVMNWQQDAALIIPGINKVIGKEVRSVPYMHWWTFLGAYMEMGEGLYSEVVNIREKRALGKKLEKHEREFYQKNKSLIDLKKRYSDEDLEEQERLLALLEKGI